MNLTCNSLVTDNARRTDKVDGPGGKHSGIHVNKSNLTVLAQKFSKLNILCTKKWET